MGNSGIKLYTDLASWWPLLSTPADYEEEAAHHWRVLSAHAGHPIQTLLELGCGGGNNALFLKRHCRMVLSDVSPQMLEVSQAINPECEHVVGDMKTLRLGRTFDAVFVHDAVMYMRDENDLRAAMATAFAHCRPGGAALLVPDCTRDTFEPYSDHGGHDGDGRGLRYFEWAFDPDPTDTEYCVEMVYLLREGSAVRVEHERHRFGLFARETWLKLLKEAGFEARCERCNYEGAERSTSFVGISAH